jgi:hypothetical protein
MNLPQVNVAEQQKILKHLGNQYWRLNNLYYIKDKYGKKIKFKMNWAQEEQYWGMHLWNLDLKARQLGMTTFWCLFALDSCLFNSNFDAGIVAHRREDADAFFINKIQFAYKNLPDYVKQMRPTIKNEAGWLILNNNSSIRVSTSLRSGTCQFLHVSEFGKICAQWPEKAREIVTGAFESVGPGQIVVVESTAEGANGYFYNYCMDALARQEQEKKPTDMDFKLFFFPWWKEAAYMLPADQAVDVVINEVMEKYFENLIHEHGIHLNQEQKAWYVKKLDKMQRGEDQTGGSWDDLKREHPSYPREAFEQSVMGAYYSQQFAIIQKEQRITKVPHRGGKLVDTWWDLGVNDHNCIVFTQNVGRAVHVIDYYENSGEGLSHYVQVLKDKQDEHSYTYGRHVAPHDIIQREWTTGKSRWETAGSMGINFEVAPKLSIEDGIEAVRKMLTLCYFDEKRVDLLIKALRAYRKDWDATRGIWRNKPLHNWASHAADSFRTMAVAHNFNDDKMDYGVEGTALEVPTSAWS